MFKYLSQLRRNLGIFFLSKILRSLSTYGWLSLFAGNKRPSITKFTRGKQVVSAIFGSAGTLYPAFSIHMSSILTQILIGWRSSWRLYYSFLIGQNKGTLRSPSGLFRLSYLQVCPSTSVQRLEWCIQLYNCPKQSECATSLNENAVAC